LRGAIARTGFYAAVAVIVAAVLYVTPRLPEKRPAEELLGVRQQGASSNPVTMLRERFDTLASGESLRSVFARGGISEVLAQQAVQTLTLINPGRVHAGMPIVFRSAPDSAPSEIVMQLGIDRLLHLRRDGTSWTESEERLPWTTDTVVVAGSISSTLYDAMDSSAKSVLPSSARQQLTCRSLTSSSTRST
jgi:hypothetical protein